MKRIVVLLPRPKSIRILVVSAALVCTLSGCIDSGQSGSPKVIEEKRVCSPATASDIMCTPGKSYIEWICEKWIIHERGVDKRYDGTEYRRCQ